MTCGRECATLAGTMNTNDNEKLEPMEDNRTSVDNFELDRRLVEEINILKLEGSLFCFDPKVAKRRNGRLTLADVRKEPVTIEVNPNYGQPSVLLISHSHTWQRAVPVLWHRDGGA